MENSQWKGLWICRKIEWNLASYLNFASNKLFQMAEVRQPRVERGIHQWAEGSKSQSSVMTTVLGNSPCSHGTVSIRLTQRYVSLVPRF